MNIETKPRAKKAKRAKKQVVPVPAGPEAIAAGPPLPVEAVEVEDLMQELRLGYEHDPWFQKPSNLTGLVQKDGLWWKENGEQLVVPDIDSVKRGILYELHDAPYSGHVGVARTLHAVQRSFWWPGLNKYVLRYVQACPLCQRNKATNQRPAGLLNPLQIPEHVWASVSMDYITDLPKTLRGHDTILVFVDRLSKMVHFAPTTKTVTAEGTAQLFVDHVFKLHGLPKDIVSDRDSRVMAGFFKELTKLLGTKQSPSTAFHPQSDGQTERMNRVLQDMLRHYVSAQQDDWDLRLSAAEFACNNAYQESIGTTPFRLNHGRDPHLPLSIPGQHTKVHAAQQFADRMQAGLNDAKRTLQAAQDRQKAIYDKNHRELTFQVGDEVLLRTKNIKLKHPGSPKLLPKWIGPFPVERVVNEVAYKLTLPANYRIHDVFHVSLMKPYRSDGRVQPPPPPLEVDGEEWLLVERILDHRDIKYRKKVVRREYLVKWEGYGPEHNSWEPESQVTSGALEAYEQYVGIAPLHT